MKKHLKTISLALAAALLLGACASPQTPPQENAPESTGPAPEEQKENEEPAPGSGFTDTSPQAEKAEITLSVINHQTETAQKREGGDYDWETEVFTPNGETFAAGFGGYPEILLSAQSAADYPELAAALEKINEQNKKSGLKDLAGLLQMGEEEGMQQFHPYEDRKSATIFRADEQAFSILYESYYDYGGAHPNSFYSTTQLDGKGKELALADVLTDTKDITEKLIEGLTTPWLKDEQEAMDSDISDYFDAEGMETVRTTLNEELKSGDLKWLITEEGLTVFFSPYEVAAYAVGPVLAELPYEKYPELFKPGFFPVTASPVSERVTSTDEEPVLYENEELKPYYEQLQEEAAAAAEEAGIYSHAISNPGWGMSYHDELIDDELPPIPLKLTEVNKEKSDWIDETVWAPEHGLTLPEALPYVSGFYTLTPEVGEGVLGLTVTNSETETSTYFDLSAFLDPPDNGGGTFGEYAIPEIGYATVYDDTLYVSLAHRTYASAQPHNAFILAIDVALGELLWKSEELVCNSRNFIVGKDAIICGYGFTNEDDYIYILRRENGKTWDKLKVASQPSYFIPADDSLYVITYNTAYEYHVEGLN